MKILQVITLYLPDFVSGASILCQNIIDEQKKEHEVKVFCGYIQHGEEHYKTKKYVHRDVEVLGVNVTALYEFNMLENYYNPRLNSIFRKYVKEFAPDIIHFHSIQALGAQMIDIAIDMGVPFVLTMHDWWWICKDMFLVTREGRKCSELVDIDKCDCMSSDFLKKRFEYLTETAKKSDYILATSNYLKNTIVMNGFPEEQVVVNENGLIKNLAPKPKRTKDKIVFTYLGGEWPLKGINAIAEAFMFIGADDRYEARLYGALNYFRYNNIRKHNSIKLLPKFDNDQLNDVLSDSDVVIVPSIRESFSLVTREAFLCDVPVICSDCGGAPEIVEDGVNGFVFKAGDDRELARRIRFFLDHPEKIEEFKKNINKDKIVSIEQQSDELINIYKKVIQKQSHKRYLPTYKKDCEITERQSQISGNPHNYVIRNFDKMAFYLDQPFLYAADNLASSSLADEIETLFKIKEDETERIVSTLHDLQLIKRLSPNNKS